jgi:catalase
MEKMTMRFAATMAACAAAAFLNLPAQAQTADPAPIVDLMHTFAGKAKNRPSGAKGQCFTGVFEPAAEARALSKAAVFAKTSPVVARFSVGGGNPRIADGARGPNRGFSFRIDGGGDGQTEFVMINAPINFAKSPAQMLGFLQARTPGADGRPDAERIRVFTEANPETMNQARWLAARPTPGSWVGVSYHGVHAYTLTNAQGQNTVIKFRMVPTGGDVNLTDDEARAKGNDYLVQDMTERLAQGRPAGFNMMAVMGRAGDQTSDPTRQWEGEDTRPTTRLGTLRITALETNATCDNTIFAPTILADGIAGPKDDPMFEIRTPAYAISITNRVN